MAVYFYITSPNQFERFCQNKNGSNILGVDIETTGLNPLTDKIRLIQIAVEDKPVFIFDLFSMGKSEIETLKIFLTDPAKTKIFHNAKFDLKFLHLFGITIEENVFDTMLAEQVILSGSIPSGFKLKDLALKYLGRSLDKELQISNWSGNLSINQLTYAAVDAKILPDIYRQQIAELKKLSLTETAELENKAVIPTYKMELAGFKFDKIAARDLKVDIKEDKAFLASELKKSLPNVNNYNSPAQVKKALINLGLPVESTESDELMRFSDEHPAIDLLIQYKKISKQVSLLESLVNEISFVTGRIHASYMQCFTRTGRYSCSSPNLQGVPNSKGFRSCFVAEEDNVLVIADYSQIELRIIAEIANEETMIEIFNRGEDIHKLTASVVNKKPLAEVTAKERQAAKAMNFGLIYGMGYKTFQKYAKNNYGVALTDEETKNAVDNFFHTYNGIGNRLNILNSLYTNEERTLGNRRRLWVSQMTITERANAAVQGTGADILKQALINVNKSLLNTDVKLIAVVHDEIILECRQDKAEDVSAALKSLMEEAGREYLKKVPVVADVSVGKNWSSK